MISVQSLFSDRSECLLNDRRIKKYEKIDKKYKRLNT